MRIAEQFLEWANIPFVMDGVIEISNPVGGKPCILHDFAAARKVNIDRFWDESSHHGKEYVPNPTGAIIVPRLDSVWKQVDELVGRQYRRLPAEKKQELKDWLQMQIDRGNAVLQLLEELDQAATAKKYCARETPKRAPRN